MIVHINYSKKNCYRVWNNNLWPSVQSVAVRGDVRDAASVNKCGLHSI